MVTTARLRWALNVGTWQPSENEWAFLMNLIPEGERAEVSKYRFEADRKRALAGRLMRRAACSTALGLAWDAVKMARCKGGKPYCANSQVARSHAPNFNFNLSHEARGWGVDLSAGAPASRRCIAQHASSNALHGGACRHTEANPPPLVMRWGMRNSTPHKWARIHNPSPSVRLVLVVPLCRATGWCWRASRMWWWASMWRHPPRSGGRKVRHCGPLSSSSIVRPLTAAAWAWAGAAHCHGEA